MAGKTINPTRMELTRLKAKQKTALRGHKLLKDKRDGLMKQFMQEVRRTRQLRKRVEEGLAQANAAFTVASAVMSPEMLEQALMAPRLSTEVTVDQRNIMSIGRNKRRSRIWPAMALPRPAASWTMLCRP